MKGVIAVILGGPTAVFVLGVTIDIYEDRIMAAKAAAIVFALICLLVHELVDTAVFKKPPR